MAPWQLLRSGRATRAAPGSRFRPGAGASVYYSSAEAPGGRSFCLSAGKLTLQQLNRRLASYLQQVQFLEAANQRLESQIQKELDRKCPRELRELDGHLRTASLLQDQISERHSAQARAQLQLLSAELTVYDLNLRCQKEREGRGRLEAELGDLRLQLQELQVQKLPELQSLLDAQTEELLELQVQHQQGRLCLLSQVSGRVAVEMKPAESSDLIRQLEDLRQTSVTLLDRKQSESWSGEQVSGVSCPVVTFDPPSGSEVLQAKELRRRVMGLEEELTQLQALKLQLDVSGLEQNESFIQQLMVLQQRADGLCRDLDSVLQAVAQQASDHQILLDVKTRLEAEIQDYRRILDGERLQGISGLRPSSSSSLRTNVTVSKTSRAQGGNLSVTDAQARRRLHPVQSSKTVNTIQPVRVHSKQTKNSPVRSINTSNLSQSFQKPENQRAGGDTTRRETPSVSETIQQSHTGGGEVHAGDLHTSTVSAQVSRAKGADTTGITSPTPETPPPPPPAAAAARAEPETFTSKQTVTDAGLQTNETETTINAEPDVKQETHTNTPELSTQTAAEDQKEPEGQRSAQVNCTEASIQVVSLSLETPAEDVGDGEDDAVAASVVSEEVQGESSGEPTPMLHKDQHEKISAEKVEDPLLIRSDQSPELSDSSDSEQKKVTEDADAGCSDAAQMDPTAGSIQAEAPPKAASLGLELSEAVEDAEEVLITAAVVSGSDRLRSEGEETKAEEDDTVAVDRTSFVLGSGSSVSSGETNKEEDAAAGFSVATASSGKPDSNDKPENETEMLDKVEGEGSVGEVLRGLRDTVEVKVGGAECDSEMVNVGQEEEESSAEESKRSVSPRGAHVFVSPEMCVSPVETEVLLNLTDQMFRPVDPDERVRSPDSVLSPTDPEMFLSPNDSDTCLSPVGKKVCLSPDGEEEDEEACLSLTEANSHVRPVEKYILSTKDEDQPHLASFSGGEAFPENDGNRRVGVSESDGGSFGSFEGNKSSRGAVTGAKPTSRGTGCPIKGPAGGSAPETVAGDSAGKAANRRAASSVSANAEAAAPHGRFRRDSGEWLVYGGSPSKESQPRVPAANQQDKGRFSSRAGGEWMVFGGSHGRKRSLQGSTSPSVGHNPATAPPESGRFGSGGSGEWIVYGGSLGRTSSLPRTRSEESPAAAVLRATSPPGPRWSGGDWRVYGSSDFSYNPESRATLATSPPGSGRFGSRGSGEWRVYGGSTGRMSSWAGSSSLPDADRQEVPSVASRLPTSPPGSVRSGRFGSAGSGEWRVYGSSSGRLSSAGSADGVGAARSQMISPPGSQTSSGPRLSRASSSGRLTSGSVVRRSSSVGSGGKLNSSGSGGRLSGTYGYDRASTAGKFSSTGSGEWKPVYSSASARKSSVGSGGRSSGGGTIGSQRAPSPGGRISKSVSMSVSMGGSGRMSGSTAGGNHAGSSGSGSKLSGSSDRISSRAAGRTSSSSGSGRTNSTGGRVISSSDRPIRSTGSGTGGSKERISVCKMAALSMSAAGRERSQDGRKSAQRPHQQAAATPPLVQRWLTTGVGVSSADVDPGLDDIMHL